MNPDDTQLTHTEAPVMQPTEPMAPTPLPADKSTGIPQRLAGLFALLLLFAASAGVAVAYFAASADQAEAQAAAAAAITIPKPDPFADVHLLAESAYVYDLTTGKVLFAKEANAQLPLASMTKVATVLAASEVLSPDATISIPFDTAPVGSVERLAAGDVWRVRDVIDFTLIASSNGGADIIAQAANAGLHATYPQSPADSATIWRMNDLAHHLGLTNTYFMSDSGLDLSTTLAGSYGSARDVAHLFAYAATSAPALFAATSRPDMVFTSLNGATARAYNTNQALASIPGIIMGKTGYTDLAGGNLGVVFDVGPAHPVVAVVMHSTEAGRFEDMKKLVAAAITAVGQGH